MQPLQGSKSPAHFCLSMLLSSTVKVPCKALVSIFEVQRRLPRESGRDNQYCVTASYIRRRSSFPELGRGHPLLAALIGLAGSRHRAGKPRDLSPQKLERCSSRTPRHFSHSLEQTPPESLFYHFQQLRTLCPTHAPSSPIRHGFIHRSTENKKIIFDRLFYTESVRLSLSHTEEVRMKEKALILLVPICK